MNDQTKTMTVESAFFFPGQGSQSVGMLQALSGAYTVVRRTFEEASDALGLDLWNLVAEGPKDALDRTENTQPAMLAAGFAVWRVWVENQGPMPVAMAGHSLGEYTSLTAAGALAFSDATRIVAERGRLMQAAVPAGQGAMAAVLGLDDEQIRLVCDEQARGSVLEAVNYNAPGQVVIAGDAAAVERGICAAKAAGAKRALVLSVSVPSHCALMRPAAEALAERLASVEIAIPTIPVWHNASVGVATEVSEIRSLLVQQLYNPVRWVETVRKMVDLGVTHGVECGPGSVLAGLSKRIDKNITTMPVFDPVGLDKALGVIADA